MTDRKEIVVAWCKSVRADLEVLAAAWSEAGGAFSPNEAVVGAFIQPFYHYEREASGLSATAEERAAALAAMSKQNQRESSGGTQQTNFPKAQSSSSSGASAAPKYIHVTGNTLPVKDILRNTYNLKWDADKKCWWGKRPAENIIAEIRALGVVTD